MSRNGKLRDVMLMYCCLSEYTIYTSLSKALPVIIPFIHTSCATIRLDQIIKCLVEASPSLLKFEFHSEGPKGKVKKQVTFKAFKENPKVFNLGFGDVDDKGQIDDTAVTNNLDSQKVLATVALTVLKFNKKYTDCYVFVTGSNKTRTRLYRMGITNNLTEIQNDFDIYGFIGQSWEDFQKGRDYEAFLVKKKK